MPIFAAGINASLVSALVVQWIECGSPKAKIRVRFSSGVQKIIEAAFFWMAASMIFYGAFYFTTALNVSLLPVPTTFTMYSPGATLIVVSVP